MLPRKQRLFLSSSQERAGGNGPDLRQLRNSRRPPTLRMRPSRANLLQPSIAPPQSPHVVSYKMTSRERIEAALNHREPDRTPVFEYVLRSPIADEFLGRPYAGEWAEWSRILSERGWEAAVRQSAVDRLELAAVLGHDMMYVGPNPARPRDEGKPPPHRPEPPTDPVEALQRRNEASAEAPPPQDENFLIFDYLREEMRERDLDLPVLAPAYAHGVWTDVELMQTMILAPEVAHEHFSLATKRTLGQIEKYFSHGIDQIGIGGDFAGTRLIISPEAYRTFVVPEVRELSRFIHGAGGYAVNASDGDLWPVIDDFLTGCEVDGYLEIDAFAGMDLGRLKSAYGDRVTFYGNLDCGNMLSFGSPEEVRQHTIKSLEDGMGNGGHILCASNAIIASVPLENYLAVVNAHRDMFGIPELSL